jgi:hypothetical protein
MAKMTIPGVTKSNDAERRAMPSPYLNDWRWIALHEAGHAVAAAAAGRMPTRAFMGDDGEGSVFTPDLTTLPPSQRAVS